jgi:DNA-binding NarL/FixJ family response regulator
MIKVLIADDHAIVRRGLKEILLDQYPSAQIGEAGDAETLIAEVMNQEWDIVLCDISMPGRSGLDALHQLKRAAPKLPVLIMRQCCQK